MQKPFSGKEKCPSLKPSRFLFTIEKIGAFAYNKGFAFPFPSYYRVSAAVPRIIAWKRESKVLVVGESADLLNGEEKP